MLRQRHGQYQENYPPDFVKKRIRVAPYAVLHCHRTAIPSEAPEFASNRPAEVATPCSYHPFHFKGSKNQNGELTSWHQTIDKNTKFYFLTT